MSSRIPGSYGLISLGVLACLLGARIALGEVALRPQITGVLPWLLPWGLGVLWLAWRIERATLGRVLLLGLIARLLFLGAPPHLSDDVFRYLWEGTLLSHGGNPFLTPPALVEGLDEALRAQVNHPDVSTVYPPLALVWFQVLALGRVTWAQALTAIVDLGTVAGLHALGRDRPRARPAALVWALHPLMVLESANGAHLDVLAVALAVGGLVAFDRGRTGLAAALTLAGGLTKLLPATWLPAMVRRAPLRALTGLALMLLLSLPGWWAVLDAGVDGLTGLSGYARHWSFNGLLFPLLSPVLGTATRPALALCGALVFVGAHVRRQDPARVMWWLTTAFVLVSPTVHPWYLLAPVAASLALGRWDWPLAALALQQSYLALGTLRPDGSWSPPGWLGLSTWGPALLVLGGYAVWSRLGASPSTSEPPPVQVKPSAKSSRNGMEA